MDTKRLILFAIVLPFLITSCEKDANSKATDLGIITGINLYDDNGNEVGIIGNPNTQNIEDFEMYPNPNRGVAFVDASIAVSRDIYIIPAEVDLNFAEEDFSQISLNYDDNTLTANALLSTNINDNSIVLNLDSLNTGYYRVVAKSSSKTYIQNIYVDNDNFQGDIYTKIVDDFTPK